MGDRKLLSMLMIHIARFRQRKRLEIKRNIWNGPFCDSGNYSVVNENLFIHYFCVKYKTLVPLYHTSFLIIKFFWKVRIKVNKQNIINGLISSFVENFIYFYKKQPALSFYFLVFNISKNLIKQNKTSYCSVDSLINISSPWSE